ncbi:M24 family metallopeptidase [Paenibacillus sp. GCM10027626]|uniref:M24 family metallopeptidase n=1 Tax=Paenibacillus sp. GCM10027626 TaxID=3273411 RepID=UPI00363DBAA6
MNQRPVIPQEEFLSRQRQVQALLKERQLDLFIAYADDRVVFGPAHARWLFNYAPHFEPCCIFIPVEGEAVLLTGPESEHYVYATSYCRNVKVVSEFAHPDEEYPYAEVTSMERVMQQFRKQLDREIRSVGIAGMESLPHKLYKAFCSMFGEEAMTEIEHDVTKLRAVKSENEIRVIEYAYTIAEQGLQAAVRSIAEGRSERDVAAEAEYAMRRCGSEGMGIDTIVASGVHNTHPILARTSLRTIRRGDIVLLTLAPRYEGYHGALGMPIVMGTPSKEVESAMAAAIEAQQAAQEALRPGTAGCAVDRAARQAIERAGLQNHFVYSGIHSIGVIEFEPPILTSVYDDIIQENMVFSIDIPLFFASWGGMRLERGFHVTKDGARPLQTIMPEMIRL